MRIAHITISHGPLDVRVFHKECRALAAAGHEVHLLVPGPASNGDGVARVHSLPDTGVSTAYFWRIWARLPTIYRRASRVDASVYHLPDPALIPLGLLLKLRGAAMVYDAHEDRPRQALTKYAALGQPAVGWVSSVLWRVLEAVAKRTFDRFVAATPAISTRFPSARTVTVCNFPRLEEFTASRRRPPTAYRERRNDVVLTATMHPFYGVAECVRAMELLPERLGARLVIIGGFSKAYAGFQSELERLPGWERVRHLGTQPREAMVAQLMAARAGLVVIGARPEHKEALGNKMFEYMAAGIPFVCSNFPLWRGIVAGAGAGLTVDPHDPEAIAAALRYLLEHPREAEEMGARGARAVASTYNWQREAVKLVALYEGVEARLQTPAAAGVDRVFGSV